MRLTDNAQPLFQLNCKGHLLSLARPAVMGIINITEDSFYAGSHTHGLHEVVEKAGQHLSEGATILDLGAQSTRPGATDIGAHAETERLLPAIHAILHHYPTAIISVDTYRAAVAEKCVRAGASIINDISAGEMDSEMLHVAGSLQVPYIAMHMQGTPATMQQSPQYEDVASEVLDYFIRKLAQCRTAGIRDVIIDPGFGFGKTLEHNYALLRQLDIFKILEAPLLAGISRKSMIYRLLGTTAQDALNGTTVLNTLCLERGAKILRVHDVKAAMEAVKIYEMMLGVN